MYLKNLIESNEREISHKTCIFYLEDQKLCFKDYRSIFIECKTVGLIFDQIYSRIKFGFIGVCIKQNICLPTLLLGCLLNERPFVYIDIENHLKLNCKLIEKLQVTVIILDEYSEHLKCAMKAPRLIENLSIFNEKIQLWETGECIDLPSNSISEAKITYAMLTSGSTGESKIVQIPECAILPNILDLRKRWNVIDEDVVMLSSPPTFDPFMVELLLAVTSGAAMLFIGPELRVSPQHMLDVVFPLHTPSLVTLAQLTPSVFTRWSVEQIKRRILHENSTLRVLALGGERFPPLSWWQQCRAESNKTQLYSLYGTTELSCWAMIAAELDDTLGSPLSDTLLRVVDDAGQTVSEGVGEMYIGSNTRLCLVEDETWEQLRPYNCPLFRATGDLVSIKDDNYKYIERKDNVVKRWGYRVSLDHIESVATGHLDVSAACCVLQADVLALYICLQLGSSPVDTIKADLKQELLEHVNKASVPDVILVLDQLPLSTHGKVNRNKLKTMLSDLKNDLIMFTDEQELFKNLWEKYTVEGLTEDSRFISVGGNSVGAMLIVNSMAVYGFDLPVAILSCMLNNGSLKECILQIGSQKNKSPQSILSRTDVECEYVLKKRKKSDSPELVYFKMKGSSRNLSDHVGNNNLELKIVWSHHLGKCVDASATCIVYGNGLKLVVVGSHSGKLAALQLESGELVWEVQLPDRIESSLTPSLCGRQGLIGCYDGAVYCISLHSGHTAWNFRTAAMVKGTALAVNETWIVGSYDYHVYCLDMQGSIEWKKKMDGIVLATPLYLPQQDLVVVATLTGTVEALNNSNGALNWSTSLASPVFSSPCYLDDTVVVAEVDGTLHAIQTLSGVKIWKYQVGYKIFSSLVAVGDSVVFGCHDASVYRVCCHQTPCAVWSHPTGSAVYATPSILSPQHLVTVSTVGIVSVLDITSGKSLCSTKFPGEVYSSPVSCGNFVVIGCRDDNVYCLEVRNKISL